MKKETAGTVTMTLEAYNALHDKLVRYESAIRVTGNVSEYSDTAYYAVEAIVDLSAFREVIEDKLENVPEKVIQGFDDEEINWSALTKESISLISKSVKLEKEE